ncbi:MAG: M14-type cytosolic carboxypeptidase, partial [Bacteroidota bacterium]|nr:M14-type cytosolic carboxypeptidase [Bacteroidota bacterium]
TAANFHINKSVSTYFYYFRKIIIFFVKLMKRTLFLLLLVCPLMIKSQIKIFSDFENGNTEIISVDDTNNRVFFKPALINTQNTTRCWFYFGITNFDTTKILQIEEQFTKYYIAPNYPVFSFDNKNWKRLKVDSMVGNKKYYSGKFNADTLWFATGYPYTYSKMMKFVDSVSANKYIDTSTLVYSEKGLRVPILEIKKNKSKIKNMIWIIGRQHAFETTLNIVIEGMIEYFVSDEYYARKLREKTVVYIVPMMDVDNVYSGASGRMQMPVDFNRDWNLNPHWNAVKSVQHKIKETNKLYNYRIFLDVHSTYPGTSKPLFGLFNEYKIEQAEYFRLKKYLDIYKKTAGFNLVEIKGNTSNFFADAYSMGIRDKSVAVSDFSTTFECDWNINNNGNDLTRKELKRNGYLIAEALCVYLAKN